MWKDMLKDNKWNAASIFSNIVAIVVTLSTLGFPNYANLLLFTRDILLFGGVFSFALVLFRRSLQLESLISKSNAEKITIEQNNSELQKRYNEFISRNLSDTHQYAHELRNYGFQYFLKHHEGISLSPFSSDDKAIFKDFCHSLTLRLRTNFIRFFQLKGYDVGEDIAITIKLVVSREDIKSLCLTSSEDHLQIDNKVYCVITIYRDPFTFEHFKNEREVEQTFYNIEPNTVFNHLLLAKHPCFYHNDLESLGGNFVNKNPNWRKYYNSLIAVPIRYCKRDGKVYYPFGILSVDSLNNNKYNLFDDKECKNLLAISADSLAVLMLNIVWSKNTTKSI